MDKLAVICQQQKPNSKYIISLHYVTIRIQNNTYIIIRTTRNTFCGTRYLPGRVITIWRFFVRRFWPWTLTLTSQMSLQQWNLGQTSVQTVLYFLNIWLVLFEKSYRASRTNERTNQPTNKLARLQHVMVKVTKVRSKERIVWVIYVDWVNIVWSARSANGAVRCALLPG